MENNNKGSKKERIGELFGDFSFEKRLQINFRGEPKRSLSYRDVPPGQQLC